MKLMTLVEVRYQHLRRLKIHFWLQLVGVFLGVGMVLDGLLLVALPKSLDYADALTGLVVLTIGGCVTVTNSKDLTRTRREQKTPLRGPPIWALQTPRTWFIVTTMEQYAPPLVGQGRIWVLVTGDDPEEKTGVPL